ncbi:MAG: lysostaphin resistance A-like protein [bacterium]
MNQEPAHPNLKVSLSIIFLSILLAGVVTLFCSIYFPKIQLIVGEIFIIIPALIYLSLRKYDFINVFRIHKIDKKILLVSFGLGLSITILTDEMDRIISTFIKIPPEFEELLTEMLVVDSLLDGVILFFAAVVLAGLIEEMLFRGLLQKALENKLDLPYALFFSALIFAFAHPTPWLIQVLLLGLILGYLAWRSNSIIPGIILHSVNNAFAFFFNNVSPENFEWYNWNNHVNPPIVVIAVCITFYGLKWFYRFTEFEDVVEEW